MTTDLECKLHELLGHRHVHALINALRVAADRFDEDAQTFDVLAKQAKATKPTGPAAKRAGTADVAPIFTASGAERLADQFRRQASDTRELLARIECGEDEEKEAAA